MWNRIPNSDQKPAESIDELIPLIRKERLQNVRSLSMVMRILVPIHDRCTRILIRLPVNARQITLLWFLISLIACGISAIGSPWAFTLGALLLYLATILDLADGEVARYQARFMTPQDDLTTFINGMFLDRICHIIISPLWRLAIALGLYRMSGQTLALAAGVCLFGHQCLRRFEELLRIYLIERFRSRVSKVIKENGFTDLRPQTRTEETLLTRIAGTVDLWLGNGKRFNLLILAGGVSDWLLCRLRGPDQSLVLYAVFLTCGVAGFVLLVRSLYTKLVQKVLVIEVFDACRQGSTRND